MSEARTSLEHATRAQLVLGFAVIYIVWGSTYLAIRIGLETLPPFFMAAVRFLIAGTLMYLWARLRGAPRPTMAEWKSSAIVGSLLLFVGNGAVSWAEQRVNSGMASLLVATVPLWLVLCEWVQGQPPRVTKLIGVAIGLAGVGLLVLPASATTANAVVDGTAATTAETVVDPIGAIVLTISALSWTIGSLYARTASLAKPATLAIAMQMLVGGSMLMMLATATGEVSHVTQSPVSARSLLALLYLIVFGSLIAFSTYMWLLRVASPTAVGTYAYVNPVVAVLLGVLVLGERLPAQALLAMLVIVAGVAMVSLAPQLVRGFRGQSADSRP
ncbi:MAG TPA: EamA family transporter [Gemmatimonas sp.]|nr:EamA family transporter [Gemmatimonas sp.]